MNPFDFYPAPEGTHETRRMWVHIQGAAGWIRPVDGARVQRIPGAAGWAVQIPGDEEVRKVGVREVAGIDEDGKPNAPRYEDVAALEWVDRDFHPPTPPEIRAGQVWILEEEGAQIEIVITAIARPHPDGEGNVPPPSILLPITEEDGSTQLQLVEWAAPPGNAVMVRDFDGPCVWTPPGYGLEAVDASEEE